MPSMVNNGSRTSHPTNMQITDIQKELQITILGY